jgi:hypothetical protein
MTDFILDRMERLGRWLLRRVCRARGHRWTEEWPGSVIRRCRRCDRIDASLLYGTIAPGLDVYHGIRTVNPIPRPAAPTAGDDGG